ncbi:hypothetical protein GCM10011396_06930 [Undibacterium terreum]|uniref:Uncharacterized protein n=2 Tax=Undibacterium terreum TaxID=1224302 RepID=A0A916U6V3_9BURK|nr:hypothetical protein GCM10011396_06930 [Undibacterium terreum]
MQSHMEFLGSLPQFHLQGQTAVHLRTGMQVSVCPGGMDIDGEQVTAVKLHWPGQAGEDALVVPAEKFLHLHALEAGLLDIGSRDHYLGLFNTARQNLGLATLVDPAEAQAASL